MQGCSSGVRGSNVLAGTHEHVKSGNKPVFVCDDIVGRFRMPRNDAFQNGRGDGKLTALELRTGFERLMTHIARRECCCRAYKCDRVPTYGLPPLADADEGPIDGIGKNDKSDSDNQDLGLDWVASADSCSPGERDVGADGGVAASSPTPAAEVPAPFVGDHRGDDSSEEATISGAPGEGEQGTGPQEPVGTASPGREKAADDDLGAEDGGGGGESSATARWENEHDGLAKRELQGVSFEGDQAGGGEGEEATGRPRRNTVELLNAGKAIACREHALEGMVYLGQR